MFSCCGGTGDATKPTQTKSVCRPELSSVSGSPLSRAASGTASTSEQSVWIHSTSPDVGVDVPAHTADIIGKDSAARLVNDVEVITNKCFK